MMNMNRLLRYAKYQFLKDPASPGNRIKLASMLVLGCLWIAGAFYFASDTLDVSDFLVMLYVVVGLLNISVGIAGFLSPRRRRTVIAIRALILLLTLVGVVLLIVELVSP